MKSFLSKSRCQLLAATSLAALLLPAVAGATNLEPRASDTLVETDEDVPLGFSVNASDFDTLILTCSVEPLGSLGMITGLVSGSMQLDPAPNENGEATVNYTVNDGEFSATARLTVRIRPVNDVPQATAGSLPVDEDSSLAISLDAEDPEGDPVISEVITPPAHGTLLIDGAVPNYRYTPDPDYFGPDSFTYSLGDGFGTTQATISLNVAAVADAPVAGLVADLTIDEDSVGTQTVSATDADGGTLTYLLDTSPASGSLTLDPASGAVSYTPVLNFSGTVTYSWHATDGGLSSAPDAVSIIVRPVNDDDDGDTIFDLDDNCPLVSNTDQFDADADSFGDACDEDLDGDTIVNLDDNCPAAANGDQANADSDASGDACDLDDDGDGINDPDDNCPLVANADQADLNLDDVGDLCDDDKDGDGIVDLDDNCELVANAEQADLDIDGLGDLCDLDDDGDTIADSADNCPLDANTDQANLDSDGDGDLCDLDDDGDTVADLDDACPTTPGDGPDGCPLATDTGSDTTSDDTGADTGADTTPADTGADTTVADTTSDDAGADTTATDTGADTGSDTGPVALDSDRDGVPDAVDNCLSAYNPDQRESEFMSFRGGPLGAACDACMGEYRNNIRNYPCLPKTGTDGCRCSAAGSDSSSALRSTLLMALFAVVGLLWRRKPRATVGR